MDEYRRGMIYQVEEDRSRRLRRKGGVNFNNNQEESPERAVIMQCIIIVVILRRYLVSFPDFGYKIVVLTANSGD